MYGSGGGLSGQEEVVVEGREQPRAVLACIAQDAAELVRCHVALLRRRLVPAVRGRDEHEHSIRGVEVGRGVLHRRASLSGRNPAY